LQPFDSKKTKIEKMQKRIQRKKERHRR